MNLATNQIRPARAYWDSAAETYERDFTETLVGKLWREAVWQSLDGTFHAGQHVLELNCGTGMDALHLAERGIRVTGCDLSGRMIELAALRSARNGVADRVTLHVLANEELELLAPANFDGAFSNFSGLNCVRDLTTMKSSLDRLLRPGSKIILCFLGRFPLWEITWFLAHGDLEKAFRARRSQIEVGEGAISVRYPTRKQIVAALAPEFRLRSWKGIGIAVPPSYMEHWARRFPNITSYLAKMDAAFAHWPVYRNLGGCLLFEFERAN